MPSTRSLHAALVAAQLCAGCGDLFFSVSKPLAERCLGDAECSSGHCADGVCCDLPCDEARCVACVAAKSGGLDGECRTIPVGEDPDDDCFGAFGCDGFGRCQDCDDTPSFTECDDGWCFNGACQPRRCTVVTCNISSPGFVLADTGQRACFDDADALACDDCGLVCGQDAQYGWDTRFAAEERFTRSGGDEPVVQDTVSGLEWRGCANGTTGPSCENGNVTSVAWSEAHRLCDDDGWAGGGFRLPDLYELQSILDLGRTLPPQIAPAAFPRAPSSAVWSASVAVGGLWVADFETGVLNPRAPDAPAAVLCVRGGRSPLSEPRWLIEASIATDRRTGLAWARESPATRATWANALGFCEALSLADANDFRLPSRVELASLVELRSRDDAIDDEIFPAEPATSYWSSTTVAPRPVDAWAVSFERGQTVALTKDALARVRCVRDATP